MTMTLAVRVDGQVVYRMWAEQFEVGGIVGYRFRTATAADMLIQAKHPVRGRHHKM